MTETSNKELENTFLDAVKKAVNEKFDAEAQVLWDRKIKEFNIEMTARKVSLVAEVVLDMQKVVSFYARNDEYVITVKQNPTYEKS